MGKIYTVNDLVTKDKIYINKLNTQVLQDFYSEQFAEKVYIFNLDDNSSIHLMFLEEQFCHLAGFQYFGFNGIDGWDKLKSSPKKISYFSNEPNFGMVQFRLQNFAHMLKLIKNPSIYIYKASDYPTFNYKSVYFAVLKLNNRVFKLGIGINKQGIHYGETYLIDRDLPQYNFYLKPENLLKIVSTDIKSKSDYLDLISQDVKG
jgi:Barnase-EndoU-ColicinE5/D-RelE like nuclease